MQNYKTNCVCSSNYVFSKSSSSQISPLLLNSSLLSKSCTITGQYSFILRDVGECNVVSLIVWWYVRTVRDAQYPALILHNDIFEIEQFSSLCIDVDSVSLL